MSETHAPDSPASNGGRGLKLLRPAINQRPDVGFARQQWRAWIETNRIANTSSAVWDSPASNGGRGLKPTQAPRFALQPLTDSPASNGGRGLKLF